MDTSTTTTPELNRADASRKSVRLYAARKGLAPAPPTKTSVDGNGTTESSKTIKNSSKLPTKVNDGHNLMNNIPASSEISTDLDLSHSQTVDYDGLVELRRPGQPTAPPPRDAVSAIPALHLPRNPPKPAPRGQISAEDDVGVAFALGSIEKHILNVEESFKQQHLMEEQQSQSTVNVMKMDVIRKQSKRYGETENLLRPGISDMSSENDFQYLGARRSPLDESDLILSEFQRGSDGRNSIGAYSKNSGTSADTSSAVKAKLARTASDTKNSETVQARRSAFKQNQQNHEIKQQSRWHPSEKTSTPTIKPASRGNSSSVVDGGISSQLTATTISAAKRKEENLRHFEALLAQRSQSHRRTAASETSGTGSGNSSTAASTGASSGTSKKRIERPVVAAIPPYNANRSEIGRPSIESKSGGSGHHRATPNVLVTRTNVYGDSVGQVNKSNLQVAKPISIYI